MSETFIKQPSAVDNTPGTLTEAVEIAPPVSVKVVRCNWYANVTVRTAPSGKPYSFVPQQVRGVGYGDEDVLPDDVDYLLSLYKPGGGCEGCSGTASLPYPYFVKE